MPIALRMDDLAILNDNNRSTRQSIPSQITFNIVVYRFLVEYRRSGKGWLRKIKNGDRSAIVITMSRNFLMLHSPISADEHHTNHQILIED